MKPSSHAHGRIGLHSNDVVTSQILSIRFILFSFEHVFDSRCFYLTVDDPRNQEGKL